MLWAIRQIFVPVNYLRIRHGLGLFHSKTVYDFVLPIIFSTLTCAVFWFLDIPLAVFANAEMTKRFTDLLQLMIVFYMAALAAVATFDRKGIDTPLKGGEATLSTKRSDGGARIKKVLSHRAFICYLFGYLSFLSLCLYMFITMFGVIWPKVGEHYAKAETIHWLLTTYIDPAMFFVFFVAVWQLMFTSLLGVYFLTDRLQALNDPDTV